MLKIGKAVHTQRTVVVHRTVVEHAGCPATYLSGNMTALMLPDEARELITDPAEIEKQFERINMCLWKKRTGQSIIRL